MEPDHVEQLARAACERYFAPEAVLLKPEAGIPDALIFLRQGRAVGRRVTGDESDPGFEVEAGSLLPVAALLAQRQVLPQRRRLRRWRARLPLRCLYLVASLAARLGIREPRV